MATGNVLSALSLAHYMLASLPRETSPQLQSSHDAIALASHCAMIAVGFRVIGLGEDHKLEAEQAEAREARPLPAQWNATQGSYAFRYAHSQSSMEYLLKVNKMGSKTVIMGMGLGADKTASFDIKTNDYISPSSLPCSPVSADMPSTAKPDSQTSKKIIDVFISNGRLSDFGALARLNIIQKLLPSLHKEGYEEERQSQSAAATSSSPSQQQGRVPPRAADPDPTRPHILDDPLAQQPRRPNVPGADFPPPDFEDPYDVQRPPRPMGGGIGPGYGHNDLYPVGLGPNDPFRAMGPGLRGTGGGGMHPTFDDPLFGGRGQGGVGYDPQAPPGSRYDPVGPGGRPPRGSGGGFPGSGGTGGRPHNPFGGFGGGDFI